MSLGAHGARARLFPFFREMLECACGPARRPRLSLACSMTECQRIRAKTKHNPHAPSGPPDLRVSGLRAPCSGPVFGKAKGRVSPVNLRRPALVYLPTEGPITAPHSLAAKFECKRGKASRFVRVEGVCGHITADGEPRPRPAGRQSPRGRRGCACGAVPIKRAIRRARRGNSLPFRRSGRRTLRTI